MKYLYLIMTFIFHPLNDYTIKETLSGGKMKFRVRFFKNIKVQYPKDLKFSKDELSYFATIDKVYEEIACLFPSKREALEISIVDKSCGVGCGEIDGDQIEIELEYFTTHRSTFQAHKNQNTLIFYEFGRIFWVYDSDLRYLITKKQLNELRTGYAIFFRIILAQNYFLKPSEINGEPFEKYQDRIENGINNLNSSLLVYTVPELYASLLLSLRNPDLGIYALKLDPANIVDSISIIP